MQIKAMLTIWLSKRKKRKGKVVGEMILTGRKLLLDCS